MTMAEFLQSKRTRLVGIALAFLAAGYYATHDDDTRATITFGAGGLILSGVTIAEAIAARKRPKPKTSRGLLNLNND
jgi:hypothetical protein